MYKKMYVYYNKLSKQIDGNIFYASNNEEAQYIYAVTIDKAKKNNPYFNEKHIQLRAIGTIEIDGENAGYIKAYNSEQEKFDEIEPGQLPKDEQEYYEDISNNAIKMQDIEKIYNQNRKELKGVK